MEQIMANPHPFSPKTPHPPLSGSNGKGFTLNFGLLLRNRSRFSLQTVFSITKSITQGFLRDIVSSRF
jgi:hypothetical protein